MTNITTLIATLLVSWLLVDMFIVGGVAGHPGAVEVPVLGLVPCLTSAEAEGCDLLSYYGILQAVEDINSNGTVVNQGAEESLRVKINLTSMREQSSPGRTLVSLYDEVKLHKKTFYGIVGPSRGQHAEFFAKIRSPNQLPVMISYGSSITSADMVSSQVISTVPSETSINRAILCFLERLRWTKFSIAVSASNVRFLKRAQDLYNNAKRANMEVVLNYTNGLYLYQEIQDKMSHSDSYLTYSALHSLDWLLQLWVERGFMIHALLLPPKETRSLFCQVIKKRPDLISVFRLWIVPWYESDVWWELSREELAQLPSNQNCSNEEILDFTSNTHVVTVNYLKHNLPEIQPERNSGGPLYTLKRNTSSLLDQLLIKLKVDDLDLSTQLSSSAAAAYDSVWALALACSRIVMNNATISMESIIGELKLMSIRGMAKDHNFGSSLNQDYGSIYILLQQKGSIPIPVFYIRNITEIGTNICYEGSLKVSPGYIFNWSDFITDYVFPIPVMVAGVLLDVITFAICMAMLIPLAKFWNNKHVKAMSPVMVVVALLCCATSLPFNINYALTSSSRHYQLNADVLCVFNVIFANSPGLTVAFAIFLAKSWRLYRIFNNSQLNSELKGISKAHLGILVTVIVAIQWSALLLRVTLDPDIPQPFFIPINNSAAANATYCKKSFLSVGFYLDKFLEVYFWVMVIFILIFSYKNIKVLKSHFREEGQSMRRLGLVLVITVTIYYLSIVWIINTNFSVELVFWVITGIEALIVLMIFAVILLPKYFMIYQDNKKNISKLIQLKQLSKIIRFTKKKN